MARTVHEEENTQEQAGMRSASEAHLQSAVQQSAVARDAVFQSGPHRFSDKRIQRRVISMTHQLFIDHYVNRDMDAVLSVMARDLSWFGPMDCQRAFTAEGMRRLIEPEYDTFVRLANENWGVRPVGGAYVVFGTFEIGLQEPNRAEVVLHQAATAVWGVTDDGPRIVHLHLSSAYDVPARIGQPLERGENAVAYVVADAVVNRKKQQSKIRFESVGGQVHYLAADEILYLETKRPVCNVVHSGGSFSIRSSLEREAKRLPESFVRVHRGYLVNAARVVSLRRYRVEFDNGDDCPIAEHRFLDVAETLEETAPLVP